MMNFNDMKKNIACATVSGLSIYAAYRVVSSLAGQSEGVVKCKEGVFNYRSLGFMPQDQKEIRYTQAKTKFGQLFQQYTYMILGALFGTKHSVDFLNARILDIDYKKQGFTMVENPIEECDWLVKANREKFYKAMETTIRELHPNVETIYWIDEAFLARSFDGGNPPAVDGPHLDYYPDQTIVMPYAGYDMSSFDIVLGLWKPANMDTPVVDYPLAIMDASTFDEDRVIPFFGEITQEKIGGEKHTIKFVSGSMKHANKQKWFYYPDQTVKEVLVWHHYTNQRVGGPFANPHTSFTEPHQRGVPARRSIETRVGLILKK